MRTKYFITRLLLLPAVFAFTISCVKENGKGHVPDAEEATVTFALNVPANSSAATRGLSENDETNVETIDVLLFRKDGADRVYYKHVLGVAIDNTPGSTKSFKTVIPVKDFSNFDISIIANARDVVLGAGLAAGMKKNTALGMLVRKMDPDVKWEFNQIPMWGEALDVDIDENTVLSGSNAVKLSRMLSRIDVSLSPKAATGSDDPLATGNANFELTSVRLYNYSTRGTVVPDLLTGWNPGSSSVSPHATKPHMPSGGYGTALYDTYQPLVYTAADEHSSDTNMPDALVRAIYTLEAGAGSGSSLPTNTCLVIGGKYLGGSETFYRIDFVKKNGSNQYEYIPLRRNFLYDVIITDITGEGFTDPDEAFHSRPVNIVTDITAWNEGDLDESTFNGQNQLNVDKSSFIFYDEGRAQTMKVYTDYAPGWEVEQSTLPSWLTVTPDKDDSGTTVEVKIIPGDISNIPGYDPDEEFREYSFWIVAGNLRKEIFITHLNEPELTIEISPRELVFRRGAPNPKSVTVTVYPETSTVYFTQNVLPEIQPISSWVSGYGPGAYDGFPHIGTAYQFRPDPNNTNDLLAAVITIYIKDSNGNFVSEYLTVRQMINDVFFERNPKLTYPGEGGAQSMTINSDADWKIKSVTPNGAIYNYNSNRHEPGYGVLVPFDMESNPNFYEREIELEIVSDDQEFTPRTETLVQGYINPYIYLTDDVTNPTTSELNLGNAATVTTGQVKVRSNALWNYTTSGSWDIVVGNIDMTTGGSQYADQMQPDIISISSKAYAAQAGTPAAGEYTATATFRSTNHDTYPANANQASAVLTVKGTVPSYFATPVTVSGTGNTTFNAQTAGITTNTNAAFTVRAKVGTTVLANSTVAQSVTASAWESKKAEVTIPATTQQWSSRAVTLHYVYNGVESASVGTVTQAARYSLSYSSTTTPASIPGEGGTYTFTFAGVTNTQFQVSALVNGVAIAQSASTTTLQHSIKIPMNPSFTAPRSIVFQYNHPAEGTKTIFTRQQQVNPHYVLPNGLIMHKDNFEPKTWQVASNTCTGLGDGWRLPTDSEMKELNGRNLTRFGFFEDVYNDKYWTGSINPSTGLALYYPLRNGVMLMSGYQLDKNEKLRFRCVRSQ